MIWNNFKLICECLDNYYSNGYCRITCVLFDHKLTLYAYKDLAKKCAMICRDRNIIAFEGVILVYGDNKPFLKIQSAMLLVKKNKKQLAGLDANQKIDDFLDIIER